MMSPGPPLQPIYPRNALVVSPSATTMAESPHPTIHSTAFPLHQLPPPPIQFGNPPPPPAPSVAPSFSGHHYHHHHHHHHHLAPLAIASPANAAAAGGLLPRQQHTAPQQQPSHLPQQKHHVPSQHHSPSPVSHQQHSPSQLQRADGRETTSTSGRILPSPSTFTQKHTTTPPYDSGYDPRFSQRPDDRRRSSLSTMVPSPTFAGQRISPPEDVYKHQEKPPTHGGPSYSLGLPPTEENSNIHREPLQNRSERERYQLQVRQQPVAARACGFGERDRRVIDPPPIVQLIVSDSDPTELRYPFNVVHCTLWSVHGNSDETSVIGLDKRLTRRLMGTLVSSPFVGQDEDGTEGCFFCFPDLSCRTHGKYRLRFVLMRLKPDDLQPEGYTPFITEALSDVFTVYTAKEFPGMRPSTALTKALKRQGCAISVKKGNEKAVVSQAGGSSGRDDGSGDEENNSSGTAKAKRRRKT